MIVKRVLMHGKRETRETSQPPAKNVSKPMALVLSQKPAFFPITHVIRRAILPRKLIPFLIKRYECESIATNVRVWSLTNEEICLDCLKNSDLSLFGCFYLALSVWDASTETTQILLFIRELSINLLLLFVLDIFFVVSCFALGNCVYKHRAFIIIILQASEFVAVDLKDGLRFNRSSWKFRLSDR